MRKLRVQFISEVFGGVEVRTLEFFYLLHTFTALASSSCWNGLDVPVKGNCDATCSDLYESRVVT